MNKTLIMMILASAVACQLSAMAEESDEEIARQLTNPLAALISVPIQLNYSENIGPLDEGSRYQLAIQPVIPFELNDDWNLISRTIFSIVDQSDIFPGAGSQTGLGDTVASFWLSPAAPTSGGWIMGAGPVFLLPTGTDDLLTTDKWGMGPTVVALRQDGPWTYGALANHIWSFAGESSRQDVNASYLQPFIGYTTPSAWFFFLQSESTYDWESRDWLIPIRPGFSKLTRWGNQVVQWGGAVNYFAASPDNGPDGWGVRFQITLVFPR